MAKQSVIDQKGLGPRVLTMAAAGMSYRNIAKALKEDGVDLSDVAVMKYLKANNDERRQATENVKAAVQAELQREALTDVQRLEELRDELRKLVFDDPPKAIGMYGPILDKKTGKPVVDQALRLKAMKEYRDTLSLRIKIAGAGDEDEVKVKVDLL